MDYEFEALNNDLEDGMPSNVGQAGATGGRRKARDLYDAFGASEDEDGLFSDDDGDGDSDGDGDDEDDKAEHDETAHGLGGSSRGKDGDREKLLGRGNR